VINFEFTEGDQSPFRRRLEVMNPVDETGAKRQLEDLEVATPYFWRDDKWLRLKVAKAGIATLRPRIGLQNPAHVDR